MERAGRKALLDRSLERAADALGDITPHVYAAFYAGHPEARASFEHHGHGKMEALEGEMVSQALYCLMEWFESPGEIEIVLLSTIPHHIETLKIDPRHFSKLLLQVCDTIALTIPAEAEDERENLASLRADMSGLFELGASHARLPATPWENR